MQTDHLVVLTLTTVGVDAVRHVEHHTFRILIIAFHQQQTLDGTAKFVLGNSLLEAFYAVFNQLL